MNLRDYPTILLRRQKLEEEKNTSLSNTGVFSIDEKQASTKNCENMIGVTQVPLGVAGPLRIKNLELRMKNDESRISNVEGKEYYVPLATTEGALVASVNRGCKAINESGGATTVVERVGTTRGPVFETQGLLKSIELKEWIESHESQLHEIARGTSSHVSLLSTLCDVVGTTVFVRFAFDTQEAMGMNMVTIATQAIGEEIEKQTGATFLSVSGNYCVDKKPSWINAILGRGFRAWSEVLLPTTVITTILKTSPSSLFELWQTKCLLGSARSGSMGFNGHAANVIAALYLATGQDMAHVVEGSSAITVMKQEETGILVNVVLPSLMVGTIGGGTGLATQKEALSILGVTDSNTKNHSEELVGIVAAAVLAGEISELAALTSHTLTKAHETYGRGGK
jgi:hydroxymethylglutaryl-CoA reductase (NADPH)